MSGRLALAVLALVAVACVTDTRQPSPTDIPTTTTTTVPATTTTTISVEEATAGFRDCLADNGVRIEDIPFDSQGRPRLELVLTEIDFSDPVAASALATCAEHLAGGALDLSVWPALQEEMQSALTEFSLCVRSQGVVGFPDPVRSFSGVGGPYPLEEIPFDDPDLEMAVEICGSRLAGTG